MIRPYFLPAFFFLSAPVLLAQEGGFLEKFALSRDRAEVLNQLVPGTDDYYYYHALHYQVRRRMPELEAILTEWQTKFPGNNARRELIRTRKLVLDYETTPAEALKGIQEKLGLTFDYRKESREARADLPSTLDQTLVSEAVFSTVTLAGAEGLENVSSAGLYHFMANVPRQWKLAEMRQLLSRLTRPDLPGLVKLIDAELKEKDAKFGAWPIHTLLTAAQLAELQKLRPELINDPAFTSAVLDRMRPADLEDADRDPEVRAAWLERLWAYASTLNANANSLKANLLYHLLALDEKRGRLDESRLLAYLKLPRPAARVHPLYRENQDVWRYPVQPGYNPSAFTGTGPVGDDEPLVRRLVSRYLLTAENTDALAPLVSEEWLRGVLAETRLLSGAPEAARWVSLLPPATYQTLRERIDIEFDPACRENYTPQDVVNLDLWVKNVPSLLVRIYEVNTANVHRVTGEQVNTALNLDGLTANVERKFDYQEAPILRMKRTFSFPELNARRGVWIVEFVGGGKASRALIRKGGLRSITRQTALGTAVRVVDEALRPVPKAFAMVGPKRFDADEHGMILLPLSTAPGEQKVIIDDGTGFTSLETIPLQGEAYSLEAGFHVPRESLLPGAKATLAVKPVLLSNGRPAPLEMISEAKVTITSTTLDGTPATTVIPLEKLPEDGVVPVDFTVPDRLASLSLTLTGQVKSTLTDVSSPVTASDSLKVNGVTPAGVVSDLHLSRDPSGWRLECLGLNGEPRQDREVKLVFTRPEFLKPVTVMMKTAAGGAIPLGKLEGITSLSASAGETTRSFDLTPERTALPDTFQILAGESFVIPWQRETPPSGPGEVSLLERRGGSFVREVPLPAKTAGGYIVWNNLAPGSYSLFLRGGEIRLRVAAGEVIDGHVIAPAATLELTPPRPLSVGPVRETTMTLSDNKGNVPALVFQIGNASAETRVHVFASRFLPEFDAGAALGALYIPTPLATRPAWQPSAYLSSRNIGDEYRYVLERRGAPRFAGNLLSRPGLLLNPWEIAETRTELEELRKADDQPANAPGLPGGSLKDMKKQSGGDPKPGSPPPPPVATADLSFLAAQGAVLLNLKPDAKGFVIVPRVSVGDRSWVRIVASDGGSSAVRDFSISATPAPPRDLRLTRGLPADGHYSQQDRVSLLEKNAAFRFNDALAARFQTYQHLGSVHRLFTSLTGDPRLAEFSWLLEWPGMDEARRRELYSRYACHELNFFLSRKDPGFFKTVILPYLASKKDRTFMDEYLLGLDLTRHLQPWYYDRLNTLEKLLLAQRIATDAPVARRTAEDWISTHPADRQRDQFLFETALRGRALAGEGGDGETEPGLTVINGRLMTLDDGIESKRPELGKALGHSQLGQFKEAENEFVRLLAADPGNAAARQGLEKAKRDVAEFYKNGVDHTRFVDGTMGDNLWSARMPGKRTPAGMTFGAIPNRAADAPIETGDFDTGVGLSPDAAYVTGGARSLNSQILRSQLVRYGEGKDRFFRQMEPTREWAEQNYYNLRITQQGPELVPMNRFWRDYALWDGKAPFISAHLADAAGTFTQMALALAVLDLPFPADAKPVKTETKDDVLTLTPASGGVIYHQEVRPAAPDAAGTKLLVSQNFYRDGDRYVEQAGEKQDKFVSAEFLTGTVYGCQVVVTNPTSSTQRLDVLFQIPMGALPVKATRRTWSQPVKLEPFRTQTLDFHFYFPAAGKFTHFPVHVSREAKTAASAAPFVFNVVDKPQVNDPASWEYLSQNGGANEVLAFMEQHNLYLLDLDRVLWRMKDADFFRRAIALLKARHVFHAGTWSHAVYHNAMPYLAEYLMSTSLPARCGSVLEAPLLTVDPVDRRAWQLLEYDPLINARAHRLGGTRVVLNDRLRAQWTAYLQILAAREKLESEDLLLVSSYLALQDRVEEALEFFSRVERGAVAEKLQYEYLRAWLAICQEDTATARRIAKALATYPVDHWAKKFTALNAQLDEIEGKAPADPDEKDREGLQNTLADREPSASLVVENRMVTVKYRNLSEVTVNYYPVDLEFLFSSNPFVTQGARQSGVIRPNRSEKVMLPADRTEYTFALPAAFQNANVLVELNGAGQSRTAAVYANDLDVRLSEGQGQLTVTRAGDKLPLPKTYVKVFADQNGTPVFYKDGYTDLRGKFDYASLGTGDLDSTRRFSILIMSGEHGAVVKEVKPPAR